MTVDSLHNVWHPADRERHPPAGERRGAASSFRRTWIRSSRTSIRSSSPSVNSLGLAMTWRLTAQGKVGITNNSTYDAWTPSRAYMHYHGGARILTETASANIASPITMPVRLTHPGRGYDSKLSSWNFLVPWQGGTWTIGNIVDYQTSASWALLEASAAERATWLESFARVSERAVRGEARGGARAVAGGVPDSRCSNPTRRRCARCCASCSAVRSRSGARRRRSSRTGCDFRRARTSCSPTSRTVDSRRRCSRISTIRICTSIRAARRRHRMTSPRRRCRCSWASASLSVDSFPVTMTDPIAPIAPPVLEVPGLSGKSTRRIAIYRSWNPSMDEGWTRFVFDQYRIPFTVIGDRDVHEGKLADRFDAIVIPDESPRGLQTGPREKFYPDSLKGGLGVEGRRGAARVRAMLAARSSPSTTRAGGRSSALSLPVNDVLAGLTRSRLLRAGLASRAQFIAPSHPLNRLMLAHPAAWFEEGPAFEITDTTRATAAAVYPSTGNPLLSGWLLGGNRLLGKAALVDVRRGRGTWCCLATARSTARRVWQCTRSCGRRCSGGSSRPQCRRVDAALT